MPKKTWIRLWAGLNQHLKTIKTYHISIDMKRYTLITLIALLGACQQNPDTLEGKQKLLSEKQDKMADLKEEINTLKEEIAELDTTREKKDDKVVTLKTLSPETFEHFVELTGTVTSKENIMISAETGGRVEAIPAHEGQKVSRGTVLVRIENEALGNQLNEARSAFNLAETTYQKRKNLWDQNIGSEIEYLQAKNTYETSKSRLAQVQAQYDNTIIKAPISGTVDDIRVKEGEFVGVGSPVVRVVDLQKVEIEAELSEEYLPNIHRGDSVKVKIPALGVSRMAPVTFVSQVINPNNRSFKVKVNLKNEDGVIKPNVLANLMIRDYRNPKAIVVPSNTVNKDLKGDFVYVAAEKNGEMIAQKKYVETGKSFGPETEITKGLDTGDKVIVSGFNQVNEGESIALK